MKFLTNYQENRMCENGKINAALAARDGETEDFRPVVKLICPWNGATWLLTELDAEDPDVGFGLVALAHGRCDPVPRTETATAR
jgi:hypothetical protein